MPEGSDGTSGSNLVLIDFSIAIVQDPDEPLHGLSRAAGTLYYMAPEQAIGYADESSDIYSLAKILIRDADRSTPFCFAAGRVCRSAGAGL